MPAPFLFASPPGQPFLSRRSRHRLRHPARDNLDPAMYIPLTPRAEDTPVSDPQVASLVDVAQPTNPDQQLGGHRNFVGVIVISLLVLLGLVLCVLFSRWAKPVRQFCRRGDRDRDRRRSQVPTVLLQGPGGGDAQELKFDDAKEEGSESPRTDSGFASPGSEKVQFEVKEISQNPNQTAHPTRPKKAFQLPWSRK